MMSRPFALIAIAFVVGFLCAWLAKPREVPPPPADASAAPDTRPPPRTTRGPRDSSSSARADGRIVSLLDDGEDWQPGLDEDFAGLVAALQRRAGFGGLNGKAERLLESIVVSWYDSDPDAAVDWVLGLGNPKDETALMTEIVGRCAEDDWQAAVALAAQHGAAAGRRIDMPRKLAKEVLQTLSPEDFVRIERMFVASGRLWKRHSIEVGDDFRFVETLDLYGGDKKPEDVLGAWAGRDFGAAWEWANQRDEAQFKDEGTLAAMATIWAEEARDEEVAGFAAYLIGEPGPDGASDRNLEIARRLLKQSPTQEVFQSVLAQSPGDRQENLNRLLRIGISDAGSEDDIYREELLFQMTEEERFTAFESLRDIPPDRFERILTNFGHSPEEIARMLRTEDSP